MTTICVIVKRDKLTMQAYEIHADNLWMIGVLSDPPMSNFFTFSKRLRNIREEGVPIELSNALRETFFFE